jgi:hypothetical protein
MKEVDYKLVKEVNGEPNPYSGKVVIKLPKFAERSRILREVNFKRGPDGEVDLQSSLEGLEKLDAIVKQHVVKMDVKKGKKAFHTCEELEYDSGYGSFINEVAGVVLNGVDLGNV